MGLSYLPTQDAEEWRKVLADPEKQWRTGYSARALAYCWQEANDFPPEVVSLFSSTGYAAFQDIELLVAFPEYQVALPGGSRPSQNDLFILAKAQGQLISITIEGKVSEPFGPTVAEWGKVNSRGREIRLTYLLEKLGLRQPLPPTIRYQLLHRAVSAVI
jgi:hypothetical protein